MTIKILPPQLANQIAAGEVVERPASVVKELVENALDSGANKIEIEIDKGGHKKILVRDNGAGIVKEQLPLALSRHATSKISDIEDLEAIVSLGFRGEALASISSVSRLTISSRPAGQSEAWSAIAEGLDMDVEVKPSAHPNGTSVEVLDLFFNTPARRKFLRAEKTEFSHIETLIKRIALSRPDIEFVLKHNNKQIKRYRRYDNDKGEIEQKSKRIADVINQKFIEQSGAVCHQYDEIKILIWAKTPQYCVSVNPSQYAFVNGRMMRDKLIQHAIRQAYDNSLGQEQQPEYTVFIELPATDVDVNVHPAKHEVRFHHARLLHDLIVKCFQEALTAQNDLLEDKPDWLADSHQVEPVIQAPITNEVKSGQSATSFNEPIKEYQRAISNTEITKSELKSAATQTAHFSHLKPKSVSHVELDVFSNSAFSQKATNIEPASPAVTQTFSQQNKATFQLLKLEKNQFGFGVFKQQMWVVDLQKLFGVEQSQPLSEQQLTATPLLVPVRFKLEDSELNWCNEHVSQLANYGFDIVLHQSYLIIKQVPNVLRSGNAQQIIPQMLTRLFELSDLTNVPQVIAQQKQGNVSIDYWQNKLLTASEQQGFELELSQCGKPLIPADLLH